MKEEILNYDYPKEQAQSLIKVIGVGGGGGNAVNSMYQRYINNEENDGHNIYTKDITFLLCNTDKQDLAKSIVPNQLMIGPNVTYGLGAGSTPELAKAAAEESAEDLRKLLDDGLTRMVFITAGMGGGTGTGAAPVVARVARELDILTIGIVTIPFLWEGPKKILSAIEGVEELRKHVDAILIINNERLHEVYPDLDILNGLEKANLTLHNAAFGISELITRPGIMNRDFADVKKTLKDGGVAIISTGFASGENRIQKAIENALNSPLLNNNNVFNASRILINIYCSSKHMVQTKEMSGLHEFIGQMNDFYAFDSITGLAYDETLDEQVKITILASGFDISVTKGSLTEGLTNTGKEEISKKEEQDRRERDRKKLESYYGPNFNKQVVYRPVVLSIEELDNDELIFELDETPTLNRRMDSINEIRKRLQSRTPVQGNILTQDQGMATSQQDNDDLSHRVQTIRFN